MQTHSFIADTAHAAVEQIRHELGPNAVVLSVRKLPRNGLSRLVKKEQIEVVATVESPTLDVTDESPDPMQLLQDEVQSLKTQFAAMRQAQSLSATYAPAKQSLGSAADLLMETGILPELCERVLQQLPPSQKQSFNPQTLQNILRSKWRAASAMRGPAAHLFIGTPGTGKSTVLCKMLAQTVLVERQPATVYQLDTHLANSAGQTAIFAEIIGAEFERTLPVRFEPRAESVFIDVPGVALGDERGLAALKGIIHAFGAPQIHLVLNCAYDASHLLKQVAFFSKLGITDLVATHLDEENRWGKMWNLILGTNFNLRFLSSGQNVPGDLLVPTAELILDRQFGQK